MCLLTPHGQQGCFDWSRRKVDDEGSGEWGPKNVVRGLIRGLRRVRRWETGRVVGSRSAREP